MTTRKSTQNGKRSKLNLSPIEDLLMNAMRPNDVVEALTDILLEYAALVPDEEGMGPFRDNVATIDILINVFRDVEKLSNGK